nr:uncharacterized PE-PGRS family protein PE_PGRS3-like [Populus alba]
MQVLIARNRTRRSTQGLVVAGGGERNGTAGIVVGIGIVGIEGMLGSGGKVTLGAAGIVGMLGSGGKVGFGSEGRAVGKVGCGSGGTEGNGGSSYGYAGWIINRHEPEEYLFPAGGGERNGIEGIVVGIGIVGIVVGIGIVGIFEGMLGSGGRVGLGSEGCVVGKVGKVGCGSAGMEGIGGNVGLGKFATEGSLTMSKKHGIYEHIMYSHVSDSAEITEQSEENQGLVVAGGGEKNGIEGIAVGIGIVGIEGMLGSGGKVTLGTAGIVGSAGRLGSGGKAGLGRED